MSARKLQRLIALAREHDPSLYAWLASATAEYQSGENLERALGLCGPGAMRERDAALREAADWLDPKGQMAASRRAQRLAERIRSFERAVWPRYQDHPEADSHGVNAALLRAFRSGAYVPRGQRQLTTILQNPSDDCSAAA